MYVFIGFHSITHRGLSSANKTEIKLVFNLTGFFDYIRNVTKWIICDALVLDNNTVQMNVALSKIAMAGNTPL